MQLNLSPLIIGALALLVFMLIIFKPSLSKSISIKASPKEPVTYNRSENTQRIIRITLFVISGIPLILTPFVWIANLMSLAGYRTHDEPFALMLCMYLFVFITSSYPGTYAICLWYFLRKKNKKLIVLVLPYLHIALAILIGYLWNVLY